ncbi:MAG: hypothetical protein K8J31_18230 [Anaerolineae bacterium]|nr:hypothetical protein [Anaerolineae bacterium]
MNPWHNTLAATISLDGRWSFRLGDQAGSIDVPGTWEAQGYARRLEGPAEFETTIPVPAGWRGQRIQLQFDAVSYHVAVQVNGQSVGTHSGLWTPFAFDVTDVIQPGEDNHIHLTVYKPGERFPMRESLAGFLPDVSIPFGGIWQSARLAAFPGSAIDDVWILADAIQQTVHVQAAIQAAERDTVAVVRLLDPDGQEAAIWRGPVERIDIHLLVDSMQSWSPVQPRLYTAEIMVEHDGEVTAQVTRTFGFRTLSNDGAQLRFNGEPVCLRGVLSWGWYPDLLCPAPDEATIRDEFRRVRALGYNLIKLCLFVPAPRYFEIADEEGLSLWLELPMWLPEVTPRLRAQAPVEYRDMLALAHAHPSIVLYSLGCELGHGVDAALLGQLDELLRSRTCGVLACDNSGSGEAYGGLTFDYADFNDYHFYCDLHYFNPLVDHFRRDWRPARPWIFGEFCDADDYRDLETIAAAHGGDLPWWFTERNPIHAIEKLAYPEQRERMAALDTGFDYAALEQISRQQSFVVRKAILEKVRARGGMGGYVVTGMRDTPLATSAMFDDLGRTKYPIEAFRAFNADTVLLLEQGRARVWQHGGDRPAPVDRFNLTAGTQAEYRVVLAHSGAALPGGELDWQVVDSGGSVIQEGRCPVDGPLPAGEPREIASIAFPVPPVNQPGELALHVRLNETVANRWPLWIYPAVTTWPANLTLFDPAGTLGGLDDLRDTAAAVPFCAALDPLGGHVLLAGVFTPEVQAFVHAGGRAILFQTGSGSLPVQPCPFWREAIKLLHDHPALRGLPHQGYADVQFYHLASDYTLESHRLAQLVDASQVTPIIQRLDARLFTLSDYLVELRIGAGIALASTLRFAGGAGDQVGSFRANIAGRSLLHSMLTSLMRES